MSSYGSRTTRAALVVCVLAAAGLATPAMGDPASTLPLKRITLYRSGVGAFEHLGQIEGNATVSLRFDTNKVNDILKSLTVAAGAGRVDSVRYESLEPLERRLASFGVNLGSNPNIASILGTLRGESIRIQTSADTMQGVILGVEQRTTIDPGATGPVTKPYVNLLTDQGMRSVNIYDVSMFELLSAKLNSELHQALAMLASARLENAATVDISFSGAGKRLARVVYVHETPVWKTTYRLSLPESGGDPRIQSWAIIENTTQQDWSEVELALVSGNPVGFQMNLHSPLYIPRPWVGVPVMGLAAAKMYEDAAAGFGTRRARLDSSTAAPAPARAADRMGQMLSARGVAESADSTLSFANFGEGVSAQAQGAESGEQFRYQLEAPVTIERQRSAMLPILTASIKGERVSVYNPSDHADHPMRGMELTNTSGLELTPGPISVYDGEAYAGDALIGFTSRGQQRLISYAVDLDVRVLHESKMTSELSRVAIADGMLIERHTERYVTDYTLINRDEKRGRTVLVEQPKRVGWTLAAPKTPRSESQTLNRFEVKLDPGKTESLQVVEERTVLTRLQVSDMNPRTLLGYIQSGKAPGKVAEAIRRLSELQGAVNRLEEQIALLDRERSILSQDQDRIRRNMSSGLDRNSDLYRQYVASLTEQEPRLREIQAQWIDAQDKLTAAKRERDEYLRGLTVE